MSSLSTGQCMTLQSDKHNILLDSATQVDLKASWSLHFVFFFLFNVCICIVINNWCSNAASFFLCFMCISGWSCICIPHYLTLNSCPTLLTTVLRLFPFVGKVAYLSSTADFQLLLINMSHHQLGFATVVGSIWGNNVWFSLFGQSPGRWRCKSCRYSGCYSQ